MESESDLLDETPVFIALSRGSESPDRHNVMKPILVQTLVLSPHSLKMEVERNKFICGIILGRTQLEVGS